jgi:hypothetical protein
VSGSTDVNAGTRSGHTGQQETISKNESTVARSTTPMPHKYTWSSNVTLPRAEATRTFFNWYVLGAVCSLMIAVTLLIVTIAVYRRAILAGLARARRCSTFVFCSCSRNTYDEVNERCCHRPYVSLDSLHTASRQKTEPHYASRDVTDLRPQLHLQRQQEIGAYRCSGVLETNIDTLCTTLLYEGHIYEVIY